MIKETSNGINNAENNFWAVGDLVLKRSHQEWEVCSCITAPTLNNLRAAIVVTTAGSIKLQLVLSMKLCNSFSSVQSVQFSSSVVSNSLRSHELQHARPPCPSPTPGVHPNLCPSRGDAIQPSHPLWSPSPPARNLFQHQSLFQWVSSSHEVAKVLEFHSALASFLPKNT